MKTENIFRFPLRALAAMLLVATLACNSGCFLVGAAAAGAGAVAYVRGELNASLGNKYDDVLRASNRAMVQLEFAKVSESKDALQAQLIARTALDKRITITIKKTGDAFTRLEIRVGTFGDEMVARTILDKINANL